MAKVKLTPPAESDLFDIWVNIAADNMRAADKLIERIMHVAQLAGEK